MAFERGSAPARPHQANADHARPGDCQGGTNQQWNVNSNGTITGVQSGLCLDVAAGGTKVQLWSCTGAANQQWSVH